MGINLRKDLEERKKTLTTEDLNRAAQRTKKFLDKREKNKRGITRIPKSPGAFEKKLK